MAEARQQTHSTRQPRHGLGALKSPPDPKEMVAERLFRADTKTLPEKVDWRKDMPGPRNQGSRWTCSAFVGAAIMAYQKWRAYQGLWSPEFLYARRSNFPVRGMFGRDVVAVLKNEGCVKEDVWPYEPNKEPQSSAIPYDVMQLALKNRIHSHAAIMTADGLKRAVATDGPCYISLPCFSYNLHFWKREHPNQDSLGGHAVTVVGYNTTGFILQNSWGREWGNHGYTVLPYDDFSLKWESYTCVSQATMQMLRAAIASAALQDDLPGLSSAFFPVAGSVLTLAVIFGLLVAIILTQRRV